MQADMLKGGTDSPFQVRNIVIWLYKSTLCSQGNAHTLTFDVQFCIKLPFASFDGHSAGHSLVDSKSSNICLKLFSEERSSSLERSPGI